MNEPQMGGAMMRQRKVKRTEVKKKRAMSVEEMRARFGDDADVLAFLDENFPVRVPRRVRCIRFADCGLEIDEGNWGFCIRCVHKSSTRGAWELVEAVDDKEAT